MKILCGVDFSARALGAARLAADLVRRTGGELELIHVAPAPASDVLALATDAVQFEARVRGDARSRLAQLAAELSKESGVPVKTHLAEGEVEWSLLGRARDTGADLLAVGCAAEFTWGRLILGGVAERTVRVADRPVLVVPAGVDSLPDALDVMVALDGRAASDGALEFARALRRRVRCDVTLLRLYWPIEEFRRLGLAGPRELFAPDPDVVADLERAQRTRVGVLPGAGAVAHAIEPTWGEPASAILAAAHERGSSLLVMGAESRHGLARLAHPPVSARVARRASEVPVVFAPAPPEARTAATAPGFLTVLAATDLSDAGNRAIPHAYSLLAGRGGVVELCHIHERALADPPYAYDCEQGKLTVPERARLEAALRALIPADAERMGITTHVSIIDGGKAAEAIVQAAARTSVDAIVLGTRGRGGLRAAVLGSVSRDVTRESTRPVLVVP